MAFRGQPAPRLPPSFRRDSATLPGAASSLCYEWRDIPLDFATPGEKRHTQRRQQLWIAQAHVHVLCEPCDTKHVMAMRAFLSSMNKFGPLHTPVFVLWMNHQMAAGLSEPQPNILCVRTQSSKPDAWFSPTAPAAIQRNYFAALPAPAVELSLYFGSAHLPQPGVRSPSFPLSCTNQMLPYKSTFICAHEHHPLHHLSVSMVTSMSAPYPYLRLPVADGSPMIRRLLSKPAAT